MVEEGQFAAMGVLGIYVLGTLSILLDELVETKAINLERVALKIEAMHLANEVDAKTAEQSAMGNNVMNVLRASLKERP